MFACLARIALDRGCSRIDWWCLDWNERSIAFYRSVGARPMSGWTVYRVDGQALLDLARSP
jgi:RimJ/RimL family protein N-acetyltransferase